MKVVRRIAEIVLIITGVFLLTYPVFCEKLREFNNQRIISEYNSAIESMSSSEKQKALDKMNEYNKSLSGEGSTSKYSELMNDSNALGYIDIPKIGIFLPIYSGSSDFALSRGIGHMENTSLPIGGVSTHCVLTGHTGMAESPMFSEIDKLSIGDIFYIHTWGSIISYKVDQVKVVLPNETEDLRVVRGQDYVTLLTCTPFGINSHRLLVRGTRIPYDGSLESLSKLSDSDKRAVSNQGVTTVEAKWNELINWCIQAGVILLLVILVVAILLIVRRRRRRRNDRYTGGSTEAVIRERIEP